MRSLFRLLVVLVVCFVAIALPAAPAQANGAYITFSTSSGVPGEEVTVRGYNFTADKWVDIYYDGIRLDLYVNGIYSDGVKADEDGDFRADFFIPESYTGDHDILAKDTDGVYYSDDFTVKPGLTVSPEKGAVGINVTVEGHGFAEDEEDIELRYYIDSDDYETIAENIEADEDGWWQRNFLIPPSSKGNHKIDARGDESSLYEVKDATFKVTPVINILDGPSGSVVDKPSGSVGDNITMTGSGFYAGERGIKVLFADQEVITDIIANPKGEWEASFKVPEIPTGEYSVTAEGERTQDISGPSFKVEPDIVLSPDEGHVGTNLTVTGHGFAANKNVVIKYDASQKATARTNANGSFPGVTFSVPHGIHGAHQVTAKDAADNEAAANFTMESDPPPTPALISPPDGGRVGFIGRMRPTFEWSEVSDDSGVYYRLQIATSANVTATGEFVDPLVSKNISVGTNYTLEKTEALPYGTYYWIVQAVDGAENESGWTAAYSFRSGLLPLWAFIVIIVVIAAGIGAAVYFFIIKKKVYYY